MSSFNQDKIKNKTQNKNTNTGGNLFPYSNKSNNKTDYENDSNSKGVQLSYLSNMKNIKTEGNVHSPTSNHQDPLNYYLTNRKNGQGSQKKIAINLTRNAQFIKGGTNRNSTSKQKSQFSNNNRANNRQTNPKLLTQNFINYNSNKNIINNKMNIYFNNYFPKKEPSKLNLTNYIEDLNIDKTKLNSKGNNNNNQNASHRKTNSNNGFINLIKKMEQSNVPNLKRSLSGESFGDLVSGQNKTFYKFNKIINLKKAPINVNKTGKQHEKNNNNNLANNSNSYYIESSPNAQVKNKSKQDSIKPNNKSLLSPYNMYQTQSNLKNVYLSGNKSETSLAFKEKKNKENIVYFNNQNKQQIKEKNKSQGNMQVITEPQRIKNKRKLGPETLIDLEKIKSFAGLFNLTTNKKTYQNAIDYNSINSPEDLHFFYITTIQNGKKLQNKFENKKSTKI